MNQKFQALRRGALGQAGVGLRTITMTASFACLGLACSSTPTPMKGGPAGQGGASSQTGQAGQQGQAGSGGVASGHGGQTDQGGQQGQAGSDGSAPVGSGGSAPVDMADAAVAPDTGSGPSDATDAPAERAQPPAEAGVARVKVLYVAGTMPQVGIDLQIHNVLKARNMDVEDIREVAASPTSAQGKQLIIVSYSILSTDFKAADFAGVAVPLIVMEDHSYVDLGMTTANGWGAQDAVSQITITSNEPTLTAGLPMGDVTVYSRVNETFWGIPGPGAIKVASVKGDPSRSAIFVYPAQAMMVGRVAPAKRAMLFAAAHAPPPDPTLLLSADGLKLVDGVIAWMTQ